MFEWAAFGKVKYDGTVFNEDIVVSSDGDVYGRDCKDPHVVTRNEVEDSIDSGTKVLLVGTGHYGIVRVLPEAREFLESKHIELVEKPTPEAIKYYNSKAKNKKKRVTAIVRVA